MTERLVQYMLVYSTFLGQNGKLDIPSVHHSNFDLELSKTLQVSFSLEIWTRHSMEVR